MADLVIKSELFEITVKGLTIWEPYDLGGAKVVAGIDHKSIVVKSKIPIETLKLIISTINDALDDYLYNKFEGLYNIKVSARDDFEEAKEFLSNFERC